MNQVQLKKLQKYLQKYNNVQQYQQFWKQTYVFKNLFSIIKKKLDRELYLAVCSLFLASRLNGKEIQSDHQIVSIETLLKYDETRIR